jgi:hypothetical protein
MSKLSRKPKYLRTSKTRSNGVRVDRTGGKYGAGVIYGASLTTSGEALGHGEWLDDEFVQSVAQATGESKTGLKVRFTHPGLSADGLGTFMGRAFAGRLSGNQALADIHFAKSSHSTPDGDLADYVMTLAEEDPEAFAMSIVFASDVGAEDRFHADNEDENGEFKSPDPNNAHNLPHVRLASLRAVDFVDEPAANPGGLFHRGHEIADEADKLCAYALGLSSDKPSITMFDADPDRIASFAKRFLDNRGLTIKEKSQMAKETEGTPEAVTQEQLKAFGETLVATIEERIQKAVVGTNLSGDESEKTELSQQKIRDDERTRCKELHALASNAGLDAAKADEWIDKNLSVLEAKAVVADLAIAGNKLSADTGEEENDPYKKFRQEFHRDREELSRFGATDEDAYVRTRCRDEGLPLPPAK